MPAKHRAEPGSHGPHARAAIGAEHALLNEHRTIRPDRG